MLADDEARALVHQAEEETKSVEVAIRDVHVRRTPPGQWHHVERERGSTARPVGHQRLASREPVWYIFGVARSNAAHDMAIARTIRFPAALRDQIAADADRCGRSFEGQVIALLRRHFGEDVDIAPAPGEILALVEATFAGIPEADRRAVARKLKERDE